MCVAIGNVACSDNPRRVEQFEEVGFSCWLCFCFDNYICVSVCSYAYRVHAESSTSQKRLSDSLELS